MNFKQGDKVLIVKLYGYGVEIQNFPPFVADIVEDRSTEFDVIYRFRDNRISISSPDGTCYFNQKDEVLPFSPAIRIIYDI